MQTVQYTSVDQEEQDMEFGKIDSSRLTRSPHTPMSAKLKKVGVVALFLLPWIGFISMVVVNYKGNVVETSVQCAQERLEKLNVKRNVYWDASAISKEKRYSALGQKGATLWFTGLSGSGKSTIGKALEKRLIEERKQVYRLDGDNVRIGLNRDLGFSPDDRQESVRRVGELAALFADSGTITLVGLVSPYREHRDVVRDLHKKMGIPFLEVFVDVPLSVVKQRDTKGLYDRAIRGEIEDFTGISAPYEAPFHPEIHVNTAENSLSEEVDIIYAYLKQHGYLTGVEEVPVGYPGVALSDGGNLVAKTFESIYPSNPVASTVDTKGGLPRVLLRDEDVHWTQVLGEGWAAPLKGFMKEGVYLQSLHFSSILVDSDNLTKNELDTSMGTNFSDYTCRVDIGTRVSMPVPIVLPINEATKKLIGEHSRVLLVAPSGKAIAVMEDIEIFPHRKEERIMRTFGANDPDHPYVKTITNSGEFLIGGDIKLLEKVQYNDGLDEYRLTPAELRAKFQEMKADAVLAFQTRNPTHAGHAYLMKTARQQLLDQGYKNPVLWLSPLGGWTKEDDVPLDVRVKQHEAVLSEGMLDPKTTVLAIWPSPMIYAGPREVQWHAKSRKNAGASFFVVGRDPAGIKYSEKGKGDIYAADHGRYVLHMAPGMEDMNIISFTKVYYDVLDHKMKPRDETRPDDFLSISGSRMRKMAREGLTPCVGKIEKGWEKQPTCVPQGFMVPSGWKIVVDYYQHQKSGRWIPYPTQRVPALEALPTKKYSVKSEGTFGLTSYALWFHDAAGNRISPWHEIPLHPNPDDAKVFNFIVEIPRGTMAKMEVSKELAFNPITQDISHNRPRYYKYGVPFFNYGLFPQTWEDPNVKDTDGNGGDNDPLDVIEVGHSVFKMGSIHQVKVLGSLELIDQGEVDHKILVLALDDPDASRINTIADLNRIHPSIIPQLTNWLTNYKKPEGKPANKLAQELPTSSEEALAIIEHTHKRWQELIKSKDSKTGFWLSE